MSETGSRFDSRPDAGAGRRRWMFGLGIAAAVCAAYVAGRSSRPSAVRETGAARVLYYIDPMHPAYRSDRPGKAPDCGMDLEPVYAGDRPLPPPAISPGSGLLTPDQEQAVRLQTETVQMAPGTHGVHTVGRVAPDEG